MYGLYTLYMLLDGILLYIIYLIEYSLAYFNQGELHYAALNQAGVS